MPQMAPLSWFTLYMIFFLTLMTFNLINFYLNQPTPLKMSNKKLMKSINWKW
uniref:ATP synthase F0 subunit 8 n=1 Tax=Sambus kanssuensis TaxID=3045898 RepID=UPI00257DE95A|nr:ATP synthase F0 subunit 8 [Sambus kanssuensis]WHE42537.1 ATP synthase F0 subunit 8 [Sambus kanssuensis]